MGAYIGAISAVAILMHATFLIAWLIRRNDLADVVWGPGFIVVALGAMLGQYQQTGELAIHLREAVLLICVSIWASRLFYHIGFRALKKSEDIRYHNWRIAWGKTWVWRSYLQVFILQGIIMLIIALPIIWVIRHAPSPADFSLFLGTAIWIFGFLFESVGDTQLKKFKADQRNKGKIMDRGLWSWTRHPNYFGEVTQWWGIFVMVALLPAGWITLISPLAITYLILKVSGVPMLEELMKDRPGFSEYVRKTSKFFPLPPKP